MDTNLNNQGVRISTLGLIVGLFAMALTIHADASGEPTAIGLIDVGFSDKRMPSVLVTTELEATASQKEWFKVQGERRFIFIRLAPHDLKPISKLLEKRAPQKNTHGGPVGTYLASLWDADTRTEYILAPLEAKTVLTIISKLDIRKEARDILVAAVSRTPLPPKK